MFSLSEIKVGSTLFVNDFYPSESKVATVAFKPMKLIKSINLLKYLEGKEYVTAKQREMLNYVFGDGASIEDRLNHPDEKKDNWFHCPGTANMRISSTGKDVDEEPFYWIRYEYEKNITLTSFLNFLYAKDGAFYGMSSNVFIAKLRNLHYDKGLRRTNKESLAQMAKELNNPEEYELKGYELLHEVNFKSSKTTLARILISLLPDINMKYIVELSDFINSEVMSGMKREDLSKNIYELKGDLIVYFYNVKNYQYPQEGTLGNSCMRNDSNTEQIRFYANNPTSVSLLAYVENKKLLARAVLWEDIRGGKKTDRIYCSSTKYGTKLAAYCKAAGYNTVYYSTSIEYGLTCNTDCIVQLDSFDLKDGEYPYLDSMRYIEVVNTLLAVDGESIRKYLSSLGHNYIIRAINQGYGDSTYVSVNKHEGMRYLKTPDGEDVTNGLSAYTIVNKPVLTISRRCDLIDVNGEKMDINWCENHLINKYNALRPTLSFRKNDKLGIFTLSYMDKQHVVYSTYHKCYIPEIESEYVNAIKGYVLKRIISTEEFHNYLKLLKLRKLYNGKLVRITPDHLSFLKKQVSKLPFKESLMDIRKSRVYNINSRNIFWNGVRIKGIIVPFKQLRFVKK